MKIQEILINEAPLPPDWNKDKFNKSKTSYKDMIAYAKKRSEQAGTGSSRTAFMVPYQGRKTIIKVAKNSKGLAQNIEEIQLLSDYYLKGLGITIPMIDSDTDENQPTWLHTEFAERITLKQLDKFFGHPLGDILRYLDYMVKGNASPHRDAKLPDEVHENEYFSALQDFVVNYGMPVGDFYRKANWGLYKGDPVIIDLGLTPSTVSLYS